jgi:Transglycosylase SLT domain
MRARTRPRVSTTVVAVAFFFVVALNAPPTIPSVGEGRATPPSPEDVVVLEELLDWVRGGPGASEYLPITGETQGISGAVRSRRRSFELFRSYNGAASRSKLLDRLPYGVEIDHAANRYGLDGLLVAAVVETESSFNPNALSIDGAVGLMQIMPATADLFGVSDYVDAVSNIDVGARYLSFLIDSYDGDIELALAAYNAGPGNVSRFAGVPPFGETRRYVEQVLGLYVNYHQELWSEAGGTGFLVPGTS